MSDNIFWVIEVAIKQGELGTFKALMEEMVSATKASEADTMNYEWFLSGDSTTCHIYERYADSAAVMKHLATFGARFAERFMASVTVKSIIVYGNLNEEAKNALGELSATFMTPIGGFAR